MRNFLEVVAVLREVLYFLTATATGLVARLCFGLSVEFESVVAWKIEEGHYADYEAQKLDGHQKLVLLVHGVVNYIACSVEHGAALENFEQLNAEPALHLAKEAAGRRKKPAEY